MTQDIIKKERRRGMRRMLFIIIALTFTCCDIRIADVRVWYSPVSQFDDYLRERREKAQREAVEEEERQASDHNSQP